MIRTYVKFPRGYLFWYVCFFPQRECDVDARNDLGQTPLHMALLNGRSKIVERLIGYGASVNTVDADGNGTLHMILTRDTVEAPTSDTPRLKKVTASV